ncbi:uncharacterized protein LOC116413521 isoform X2 [Galleria mellonella]|uniref:Uncharacterized protein LOC116413521 isoform X2 n=1 Tax=Galleria mellonella TaxID=7137 RepID=A0A6J3CB31_GALME|nr:uncharacterized protein LOC116413521 isoform X2 [Galleria mellonella]
MNIQLFVSVLYILLKLTVDVECLHEAHISNLEITNGRNIVALHRVKREFLGKNVLSKSARVQSRDPTIIVTPNGGVPNTYRGLPYSNMPYTNTVNRGPTVVIIPDSGISRGSYYGVPTNVRI